MKEIWFGTVNLMRVAHSFAATPRIMAKLDTLLRDPDVALEDVADQLKHDSTLAARLLRIANSAVFSPGEPVASIQDATSLIGLSEIHHLVGAISIDHFSHRDFPLYGFTGPQLRNNALIVALLMEELASSVRQDSSTAYSAGLFRSVGKLALAKLVDEGAPSAPFKPAESFSPLALWETRTFGRTSNDATAAILHEWHFPCELTQAVAEHYDPDADRQPLAALLNLAAHLADDLGHGLPGESRYWIDPQECACTANITQLKVQRAKDNAVRAFDQIALALG